MSRPSLASILQRSSQQLIRGALKNWLDEHREDILHFLKTAQTERGAALLHGICKQLPAVAGVVTMLMQGTPEQAISNISLYDESLAAELRKNIGSFRKLQEAYIRGREC